MEIFYTAEAEKDYLEAFLGVEVRRQLLGRVELGVLSVCWNHVTGPGGHPHCGVELKQAGWLSHCASQAIVLWIASAL